MALLDKVKVACRVTTATFDDKLTDLIHASLADMGLTDISSDVLVDTEPDPLILQAICTYCACNFGNPENYDRLKASYDEQKAQLLMSSAFTDWGA